MKHRALVFLLALPSFAQIDYQRQVHAVIAERCLGCHNQEKRAGGLSLATYQDVLNGGRSGAAVKPGDSAASRIVQRVTGAMEPRMPLGAPALSDAEIATIRNWIDQGVRPTPSAAPAKGRFEPQLTLTAPPVPESPWKSWSEPIDRFTAKYLAAHKVAEPVLIGDSEFARRVFLDIQGLLPDPAELQAFLADTRPDKRHRLVNTLLADGTKYSENWISYWNDLLRNEEGAVYYSETANRKSITAWLLNALETNKPYDRWIAELLNPTAASDPEGFLIGVNWRGVVSASQAPALQASQNTAQIFLGINLKCNSCHDSFINKWKLKDAYALAGYFSAEEKLQLYRCDVAQKEAVSASFLYPELNRPLASGALKDRRAAAAAIFTDPRNGRMPRTLVNRIWQKMMGRGFVEDVDDMDGEPWSPELLDWLAGDFAANGYDLKRLIATIAGSRTYQLPAVRQTGTAAREYTFRGPELRRISAEQFADAVAAITGDWHVKASGFSAGRAGAAPPPIPAGTYVREWRMAGNSLTRALGRPIRDQVYSTRDTQATTVQALELVNGEALNHWLWRGARRMLGELPPEPQSLLAVQLAGTRPMPPVAFDLDVSRSEKLYLIVEDSLSTAPDKGAPVWLDARLVGPQGAVALWDLKPVDGAEIREREGGSVAVKFPSVLVYNIAGKGFTRFQGAPSLENTAALTQGESVNARFFVFDRQPSMDRLVPPNPGTPLAPQPVLKTIPETVSRVYWHALGRAPSADERRIAEAGLRDASQPGKPSADGLADLLWSVLMSPEFQLIR